MDTEEYRDRLAYIHLSATSPWTFQEYVVLLWGLLKRVHGQPAPARAALRYSEEAVEMFELENHRMVRSVRSLADVGYRLVRHKRRSERGAEVQAMMRRGADLVIVRRDGAIEQGSHTR